MRNKSQLSALLIAAAALGGCASTGSSDAGAGTPAAPPEAAGVCKADGVQSLIGQPATAEIGARLMRETGAQMLRWGPPRSAMTMDYRQDRLTVGYDDDMRITSINCG